MKNTKIIEAIRTFLEKLIELGALAVFLWLLFIGVYAFYDAQNVNESGKLGDDIIEVAAKAGVSATDEDFDFSEFKTINPEIVGWIQIDGTNIDFPVLQSKDNSKYLVKDYKGEFATAGSIFVDYRNNKFLDNFTVIYGHRMKNGLMFSDITLYKDRKFFDEHRLGMLYTEQGKYKMEAIGFAVITLANTDIYNVPVYKDKPVAAYDTYKRDSLYMADYKVNSGDKLLLLTTCDKDARHKRDVLLVKLSKI